MVPEANTHRIGIGTYLAAAFSLLSIVLTVVLAVIITVSATEQLKSNIGNGLADLARQTAEQLDRGMYERFREVRLMSQRSDLIDLTNPALEKRRVLDARQDAYRNYAWIGLTDLRGNVLVATRGMLEGASVAQRPWFINALKGTNVGDVHEAKLLARLLPGPSGEPKRFVDVAFPYRNQHGQTIGVLGVHLSWQWAREVERAIFAPIARHRQVESMIINSEGTVLLGPQDLQDHKLTTTSFRSAHRGRVGYALETWPDGRSYLVGYSPSQGYDSYPGLGWSVLVRQNVDDAYRPVRHLQRAVLAAGAVLALLFSVFGWILARRIGLPLRRLTESAHRIQRGENVAVSPGRAAYAEVDSLTQSLNALVSNLQHKERDLREWNQSLEKRVDDRTQEVQQALRAVRSSESRIRTIIEAAQDAFIAADLQGTITDWNSAAESLLGWSRNEAVGQSLVTLLIPEQARASFALALDGVRQQASSVTVSPRLEHGVIDRRGRELTVETSLGLAGSDDAQFYSLFLRDISERKKVEQMKNEFVSTVSHELRTPLTSIRASLALLVDEDMTDGPESTRMLIDIAQQNCERLVRLVNDILDIEKIESGSMEYHMQRQSLAELVTSSVAEVDSLARKAGVRLEWQEQGGPCAVMADADRIVQVIVNLVSNAIKFSPAGTPVMITLQQQADRVLLSVRDQGSGIPDSFKTRIFEKFAQADATDSRQKGGTGLGLSICRTIVEAHGGSIRFDSESGRGTTFYVDLPAADARPGQ